MVIEKLKDVKRLKFQIRCIENRIEELRSNVGIQAIKYSNSSKPLRSRRNIAEIFLERIDELENKRVQLQMEVDTIISELSFLPELPYRVIIYKFVDGLTWAEISTKTGYSKQSCYRFYNIAKNFMA